MFHYASDPRWYLLGGEEAPCPNPEIFAPQSGFPSLSPRPCKQDPVLLLRQSLACVFPFPLLPPPSPTEFITSCEMPLFTNWHPIII